MQFENELSQEEYDDPRFSYRVAFIRKTSNTKSAADKVIQMVPADSEAAVAIDKVFLRETEKMKYRPSTIVAQMKAEGFTRFGMKQHTDLWKSKNARNPKFQFGTFVEGQWFWYDNWLSEVRKHCIDNTTLYKPGSSSSISPIPSAVDRDTENTTVPVSTG